MNIKSNSDSFSDVAETSGRKRRLRYVLVSGSLQTTVQTGSVTVTGSYWSQEVVSGLSGFSSLLLFFSLSCLSVNR